MYLNSNRGSTACWASCTVPGEGVPMMNILMYCAAGNSAGERLGRVLSVLLPETHVSRVETLEALRSHLRRHPGAEAVTLLLAADRSDLEKIVSMKGDLLGDRQIILIVPDDAGETLALGHSLRPRFISFIDSDFIEVVAVLRKKQAGGT